MLRLFTEAVHDCLPERASLDIPTPSLSPLLLLHEAAPHPAVFIAADAADTLER